MGHLTWIPNLGTQPEHLGTCAATKLDYTGLARQNYTSCTVLYLYFSIPFTLEPGNGLHEVWGGGSTRPVWVALHTGCSGAIKPVWVAPNSEQLVQVVPGQYGYLSIQGAQELSSQYG